MDRQTIYPGQVPMETDLLLTNQNTMVALAKLSQAIFGTGGVAVGFGTTQTTVPSMAVLVAAGEIYSQQNLEATAVSSLPQDLTHSIVKQGIMLDAATVPLAAPATVGFSINYLIQVAYQDVDSGSTVLPYYNASNPNVAYAGPANSGTAQPTSRKGVAVISAKAGTAATTGTQTTPAPDAGKLGLFVVTVANGATTIVNANISAYQGAPILPSPVMYGRLLNVVMITSTSVYTPSPGTRYCRVFVQGAGGGGAASVTNGAGTVSVGSGGSSGAMAVSFVPVASIAGLTAIIGASGAAGLASGNPGGAGGNSGIGGINAPGGDGGTPLQSAGPNIQTSNLNTALASGGNLWNGSVGVSTPAFILSTSSAVAGGGADSYFGHGPRGTSVPGGGLDGLNYGCGGCGALSGASGVFQPGGKGAKGVIMIEEYA